MLSTPSERNLVADRARARRTVEIPGASHAAAVSQPDATARLILEAAAPLRAAASPCPMPAFAAPDSRRSKT
jgi:hypothetical protein